MPKLTGTGRRRGQIQGALEAHMGPIQAIRTMAEDTHAETSSVRFAMTTDIATAAPKFDLNGFTPCGRRSVVRPKAVWRDGNRGGFEKFEPLDDGDTLISDRS